MRIVALVKSVPDTEAKIKINADASDIETAGVKYVMNTYDEYAVEAFEIHAVDYLVKPFSARRLRTCLDYLRGRFEDRDTGGSGGAMARLLEDFSPASTARRSYASTPSQSSNPGSGATTASF